MHDGPAQRISCATYTHGRRYPPVITNLMGWTMPFPLTMPQIGVLIGTFLLLVKTWGVWGSLLPPLVSVMVLVAMPITAAWAVRRARIEGRSLVRAAVG